MPLALLHVIQDPLIVPVKFAVRQRTSFHHLSRLVLTR